MKENNPQGTATSRIHPLSETFSLSDEKIFDSLIYFLIISEMKPTQIVSLRMLNPLKIKHSGIFLLLLWVIYAGVVFSHFEFMQEMLGTTLLVTLFISPLFYIFVIALLLFRDLKKKGHDFLEFEDCVYLFFKLQYRIWQIPTLEQLKSKSDFDEEELNVEYLFKTTANYFPEFDYNRIRIPLLEVEEYLVVHGKLPTPPPQSLMKRLVIYCGTNYIFMVASYACSFLLVAFIMKYLVPDADLLLSLFAAAFLGIFIYFSRILIRNRFSELGYKHPSRKQLEEIILYLPFAIHHLPKRSDLKDIVDLENELEMIMRTLFTASVYKRKKLISRIRHS